MRARGRQFLSGGAAAASVLCVCDLLCGLCSAPSPVSSKHLPVGTTFPLLRHAARPSMLRARQVDAPSWRRRKIAQRLRGGGSADAVDTASGSEVQAFAGLDEAGAPAPRLCSDATTGLRFFCGTWNVNGKPPLVAVEDWLARSERDDVDIYIIALQEVQELSGTAALLTDEDKGRPWSAVLQQAVGAPTLFRCLAVRQMVGCYITLLARASLCSELSDVKVGELGTGFLNSGGNKGGVAVRFTYRGVSVCAISSHLAAQVSEVKRRNQDIRELLSRLHFVEPAILPPIKAQDVYDFSTDDEDDEASSRYPLCEGDSGLMPDVYDSPYVSSRFSRTASPLVLDGSSARDGPDHDSTGVAPSLAPTEGHDFENVEYGVSGEDSSLPTYECGACRSRQGAVVVESGSSSNAAGAKGGLDDAPKTPQPTRPSIPKVVLVLDPCVFRP